MPRGVKKIKVWTHDLKLHWGKTLPENTMSVTQKENRFSGDQCDSTRALWREAGTAARGVAGGHQKVVAPRQHERHAAGHAEPRGDVPKPWDLRNDPDQAPEQTGLDQARCSSRCACRRHGRGADCVSVWPARCAVHASCRQCRVLLRAPCAAWGLGPAGPGEEQVGGTGRKGRLLCSPWRSGLPQRGPIHECLGPGCSGAALKQCHLCLKQLVPFLATH